MNCASNIITASFSGGKTHATTARVYQWSRGIELCITGADNLPQTFKAHFSVQKRGGVATTIVCIDERVDVPNVLFTIGKDIHVWLGASETEDDAEILYTVDIPVAPAPMPEYYDAEDTGVFDEVVEQVADYAATATAAANSAGASATAAAGSASAAAVSASSAAGSATAAEQARADAVTAKGQAETAAQTATQKAQQTAQNASQAALDAGRAESSAERAESAETGAGAAKTAAEAAAQNAAASAATSDEKATLAGQSATAAAGSASAAAQSAASIEGDVQIASQKASEATTAAGQAVTAKEAAQTAQQGAETAATNAGQSASTATAKAAEAAQSASGAAQSKTDAEAAATRAEQAAATLTVDTALSDTSTNPVQNKVITGELTDVKSHLHAATESENKDITDVNIDECYNTSTTGVAPTQTRSSNYYSQIVPVKKGEIYIITGKGANAYRLWALTDSNNLVVINAPASYTVENEKVIVGQDGNLYLNFNRSNSYSVKKYQSAFVDDLEDQQREIDTAKTNISRIADISYNLINPATATSGTLSGDHGSIEPNDTHITTDYIFVKAGQSITITPNTRRLLGYSINKNPIAATYIAGPVTGKYTYTNTTGKDGYVRVSVAVSDEYMIVYGSAEKTYRAYDENLIIANMPAFAPVYENLTFPVYWGENCYKDGKLYTANQDIISAESWTAAHWDETDLSTELRDVRRIVKDDITNAIKGVCYDSSTVGNAVAPGTSSNYYSQIVPVKKGDTFYVSGQVGATSVYKLWAFTNASAYVLSNCGSDYSADGAKIVAAQDGYLYVNFYKNYAFSLKKMAITGTILANGSVLDEKMASLHGKTVLNFGDSIAAGNGNVENGVDRSYAHLIAEKYHMTLYSYAYGGATITKYSGANNYIDTQVDTAITEHGNDSINMILIDGGTNDVNNAPVGELVSGYDTSECDDTTLMGALEIIFGKLRAAFPLTSIIYIIVHKMESRDWSKQIAYHDAIVQACNKWAIPYVDIFDQGQITSYIPAIAQTCFPASAQSETGYDRTHPNRTGYDTYYNPPIIAKMKELM